MVGDESMIQKKRMELLAKSATKVIRLSDGRWGIIFPKRQNAQAYANFLKHTKLKPTKIHQTKYGFAFKFNDISSLSSGKNEKVWPLSLIPPEYDVEKHGSVYLIWDNLTYLKYIQSARCVFVESYERVVGGGINMKSLNVPYPPKKDTKGEAIPVMTTIKPDGWITNTDVPHYKFISYIWYLIPKTGVWELKTTKGLRPMRGDEIGKFITKEVRAGNSSHR